MSDLDVIKEPLINSLTLRFRHSGASRNPVETIAYWMPAFAGMTVNRINQSFLKEQIAYLKVWLGIMIVTNIGLFGWLVINLGTAPIRIVGGAIIAIVVISAGILVVHRRIERHIESLRDL